MATTTEDISHVITLWRNKLTNVFRLDICMYQVTLVVQVLQPKKNLPGDRLDKSNRHTLLFVPFDKGQQIFAERFENDADMSFLGTIVVKRVEKRDNV